MCGIFGYIGSKDPLQTCLSGLKRLEYRGYDSAGIAGIVEGTIYSYKEAGNVSALEKKILGQSHQLELAIGHTRWATHGEPSEMNAHPHFDSKLTLAMVHNGIIENCEQLRKKLIDREICCSSETDTEVIAQLLGVFYQGNLLEAVQKILSLIKGSFAIALIHKDHPGQIIAATRKSPLSIGLSECKTDVILASDPNAFLDTDFNVLFLQSDEIACIQQGKVEVFNFELEQIEKPMERLKKIHLAPSKEGFEDFMLKEIFEQPGAIYKTLEKCFNGKRATPELEGLSLTARELRRIEQVQILACGSSTHAGSLAALLLEEMANLPTRVEVASEARYQPLIPSSRTLLIAISQSGETADTLAALHQARSGGGKVVGICNVKHSQLSRLAKDCLFLKAGPEISVCSTKAFLSQLAVLYLLTLHLARLRGLSAKEGKSFFTELEELPSLIQSILDRIETLKTLAEKYAHFEHFFFMGRRYMFPICQESALKLKEISYADANGYPAGELKHGPIALLDSSFPVVAFCANQQTEDKMIGTLREVKARSSPLLAFAFEGSEAFSSIADDVFFLPKQRDSLAPFTAAVAGQLFAYFIAKKRGRNIDQPRNLAKSVTVE